MIQGKFASKWLSQLNALLNALECIKLFCCLRLYRDRDDSKVKVFFSLKHLRDAILHALFAEYVSRACYEKRVFFNSKEI